MKKLRLFTLVLLTIYCTSPTHAKNIILRGRVIDSLNNSALTAANVLLFTMNDSLAYGTITGKSGQFEISNINAGIYTLTIKYMGYEDKFQRVILSNSIVDLGTIYLRSGVVNTGEIIVTGKQVIASLNGDTTIYTASAFKVNKDAAAEDLLKKIPGVQIEQGKYKVQGEEVKKVYIDGRTYMGDDPNAAIKNLPADVIEKIQVFDEQSEQSRFTGFTDGSTTKALNFVTRLKDHTGIFGKLFGGYGTAKKYVTGGNYNYFNDSQRISLIEQFNNTNEQNFSSADLMGVMGGMQGGPDRSGSAANELFQFNKQGDVATKAFGMNYNDKFANSIESGASYFFNQTDNTLNTNLNRNYINLPVENSYRENSNSEKKNVNHRVNISSEYSIDSSNTIRFLPSFSFQHNQALTKSLGITYSDSQTINSSKNEINSNLDAKLANGLLMYRHKFAGSGNVFAVITNVSFQENSGIKKNYSESVSSANVSSGDIVNQSAAIDNQTHSLQSDFIFSSQLSNSMSANVMGSIALSDENNNKLVYDFNPLSSEYSIANTSLSSQYTKRYLARNLGTGISMRKKKLFINAGIRLNYATLTGTQSYPFYSETERNYLFVFPALMLQFSPTWDKSVTIFYHTSTSTPTLSQLQNSMDISNPLQITSGNPKLIPEYLHNAVVRFSMTDYNSGSNLFILLGGTIKTNSIGTNSVLIRRDTILQNSTILRSGSQYSRPDNFNGYYAIQSYVTYGIPVDWLSSTVNINLGADLTNTPGMVNGIANSARTGNFETGLTISSNISENLDFTLSSSGAINTIRNSVDKKNNENYFSQSNSLRFFVLAFNKLTLNLDFKHKYIEGLSTPSSFSLNFDSGIKLFSDNRGEIKFSVCNALNQNTNNTKSITEAYTQEYFTNQIGRYYLLSFTYKINSFM
ncbi:MAG: outer membrane beta-barrel protein [Ignavibacteria bacterium]|nr:outer membrane beta-barrel protein [Ignavibacteria bacterium]